MKRILTLFAVLGLVACGTSVANAVVVIGGATNNGNMDAASVSTQLLATPTGWVASSTAANSDGLSSEAFANVQGATGDCNGGTAGCGVFFKSFNGTPAVPLDASLYQDNPGTPGMKYILTGWIGSGGGYSGRDPNAPTKTELGLTFLDNGGVEIPASGSVLDVDPFLGPMGVTAVDFDYQQFMVMATAPAGTATVRASFAMIAGYPLPIPFDAALVTDNYTLTCVPEPATLSLVGLSLLGLVGIRRRSS